MSDLEGKKQEESKRQKSDSTTKLFLISLTFIKKRASKSVEAIVFFVRVKHKISFDSTVRRLSRHSPFRRTVFLPLSYNPPRYRHSPMGGKTKVEKRQHLEKRDQISAHRRRHHRGLRKV